MHTGYYAHIELLFTSLLSFIFLLTFFVFPTTSPSPTFMPLSSLPPPLSMQILSCAGSHSYCSWFLIITAMPCQTDDGISYHSCPPPPTAHHTIFPPPWPCCLLGLGEDDIDALFRAECSTVTHSSHFNQLSISAGIIAHCKGKLGAALVYK